MTELRPATTEMSTTGSEEALKSSVALLSISSDYDLLGLPPEILVEIFGHLLHTDLCHLQEVCSQLRTLATDNKLWRQRIEQDFGVITAQNTEEPAIDIYKHVYRWGWDETGKHHNIRLSNDGLSARCHHSSYCPVRGSRGVNRGMHYFEVRIDDEPAATYQAFGVANDGIDTSRSYLSGWTAKDHGIGWYNDGNVYVRGSLLAEKKFPRWHKGDCLGILINLQAAKGSFLYFYKNGVQIATKIEVLRGDPDMRMYPYCFLGQGEAVTFVYYGKKGLDAALKKCPTLPNTTNPPS
jgi:hypothetical protein